MKVVPVLKLTEEVCVHKLTRCYLHLLVSDFCGLWDWIRVVSELVLGPVRIYGGDCKYEHLHFVPLYRKTAVLWSSCQIPVLCLKAEKNNQLSQRQFQ